MITISSDPGSKGLMALHDSRGRLVGTRSYSPQAQILHWSIQHLPAGIYYLSIEGKVHKKIVKF